VRLAYVDTSCLVAVALQEAGAARVAARLGRFDRLFSSNLLEAELRSALLRERVDADVLAFLSWLAWILPDRPLTREFERICAAGYLRGADLWHVACALFLSPDPGELTFITLDGTQADIARRLGFADGG
jgi:hypothetical protein